MAWNLDRAVWYGMGARKIETEGIEMKYLLYVPENRERWREREKKIERRTLVWELACVSACILTSDACLTLFLL